MKIDDIPDDQWATVPLRAEANIGKYAIRVHNSNTQHAYASVITGIGRTNIYFDDFGRKRSLRVEPNGETAYGEINGYAESAWSKQAWDERFERIELFNRIRKALDGKPVTAVLRRILGILEEA